MWRNFYKLRGFMKSKYKIIITSFSAIALSVTLIPLVATSCSFNLLDHMNTIAEWNEEKYLDLSKSAGPSFISYSNRLGKIYSQDWYNTLTWHDWNYVNKPLKIVKDAYCESEQQALSLYLNSWGDFWNESLHKQQEPQNKKHKFLDDMALFGGLNLEIRGSDYKYISQALSRSKIPENTIAYHGVEYMEIEFWNQLKDFIKQNDDGSYDYSNCIGKTITSYGFISTSLSKSWVVHFAEGEDVNTGENILPLKEKFVFKVFIPKYFRYCLCIRF